MEGTIIKYADRFAYINHDIDDALRGGVLKPDSLPKDCIKILGERHSKRINTMITDIIKNSMDKPEICMSEEVEGAMLKLRSFMFSNVYEAYDSVKTEEIKAKYVITAMFEHFTKYPEQLPEEYKAFLDRYDAGRIICDYIAGMSDRYAIYIFNSLFVPKGWNIF